MIDNTQGSINPKFQALQEKAEMTRDELEALAEPHWSERPVWKSFDIGDGWIDLVGQLIRDIIETGDEWKIAQIKSKFGGLRFYVETESDAVRSLIRQAEIESGRLCEECGAPAKTQSVHRWVVTLCPKHMTEEESRYASPE